MCFRKLHLLFMWKFTWPVPRILNSTPGPLLHLLLTYHSFQLEEQRNAKNVPKFCFKSALVLLHFKSALVPLTTDVKISLRACFCLSAIIWPELCCNMHYMYLLQEPSSIVSGCKMAKRKWSDINFAFISSKRQIEPYIIKQLHVIRIGILLNIEKCKINNIREARCFSLSKARH